MSSKNNGFTAGDIERYHSGKLSPEETHALEKAALDDPFLADALEGYAFTSTPTNDLKKIQSRLDEKQNQKKVIPFFQKYKWLSVAALFIIVAGTGWLVYDLSKQSTQPSLAVQKEKQPNQNSNYTPSNQQVSIDSSNYSTTSVDKKVTNKQQAPTSAREEIKVTNNVSNEQAEENLVISNSRNNQSNAYYKDESNSNSGRRSVAPRNEIAGNNRKFNYAQSSAPSRNNTVSSNQRANDVTNNNIVKIEGINRDATADKPATKVSSIEQNDSVKHFDIVLQPLPKDSQPALEEVVVGYGAQRNPTDKYPKVTIDTLEPAEGYVKFDDYFINNLQMPEELKTKAISGGEVQLAFDVNQNGQPINITVVKSLCAKCDEEAIRLLKEGPRWKKKKNKKGKITIEF